jgi:hypothetical protein
LELVCLGLPLIEGEQLLNLTNAYGTLSVFITQGPTDNTSRAALVELYEHATKGPLEGLYWDSSSDPCLDYWVLVERERG